MKKIIALIIAFATLVSCKEYTHETTITYRVYYPQHMVERSYTYDSTDDPSYVLASDRGSNYLCVFTSDGMFSKSIKLEDTSAPIQVTSFVKSKK